MQLNEYEEAALRLIQSQDPTIEEILSEFNGVLVKHEVKDIISALKSRKYIKTEEHLDFAASFGDGETISSTSNIYVLTPLGKNYLANATANFTSFSNISNSNIAHQAPHAKQSIQVTELPVNIQEKIQELEAGIKKKDSQQIQKAFAYIADKSIDAAIAIITGNVNLTR